MEQGAPGAVVWARDRGSKTRPSGGGDLHHGQAGDLFASTIAGSRRVEEEKEEEGLYLRSDKNVRQKLQYHALELLKLLFCFFLLAHLGA